MAGATFANELSSTGTLHVLYFAWLRERVGVAEETLTLPSDITTVGDLVAWLRTRSPGH